MLQLLKQTKSFLTSSSQKKTIFLATSSKFSTISNELIKDGYSVIERGQKNTDTYRIYFKDESTDKLISPFHDIPLYKNKSASIVNLVVEIPRWTNAKMEINKSNRLNPIMQDTKNGKLRYVNNVFPHHGYIWNYGGLPQTWEDPNVLDKTTNCIGDNDPIDVLELGSQVHSSGAVIGVKVLGALGLIDEGEADWKILTIDVNDPLANKLNELGDIEKLLPGLLDATRDWFKLYKIPTGKPANKFAEDGKFFGKEFALELIEHDHGSWKKLMSDAYPKAGIKLVNTQQATSKRMVDEAEACKIIEADSQEFDKEPAAADRLTIDTVHYLNKGEY